MTGLLAEKSRFCGDASGNIPEMLTFYMSWWLAMEGEMDKP